MSFRMYQVWLPILTFKMLIFTLYLKFASNIIPWLLFTIGYSNIILWLFITSKFEALRPFRKRKPVVIRRLSLIPYLMIYLACISLVYALWELLSVFTEYLKPYCFCFSPLSNIKLWKQELRDSCIRPSRYTINEGWLLLPYFFLIWAVQDYSPISNFCCASYTTSKNFEEKNAGGNLDPNQAEIIVLALNCVSQVLTNWCRMS